MGDRIAVLNFLNIIRLKRVLFYNFVLLLVVFIFLDSFGSVDGKKRWRRRRKRNRGSPQMIIFNLDETIWPFKVDKVMTPPLKLHNATSPTNATSLTNATLFRNQVVDRFGKIFDLFPEVHDIFGDLEKQFYRLGVISQSTDVEKVEDLLKLFDIERYAMHEIFPGSKAKHILRMSERSGIGFEDMLYFDSDPSDFNEIGNMNVTTVLIDKNGITVKSVYSGLHTFNTTQIANNEKYQANTTTTLKP